MPFYASGIPLLLYFFGGRVLRTIRIYGISRGVPAQAENIAQSMTSSREIRPKSRANRSH